MNKHNNCEDNNQTATLPDLPLNIEHEEETKGGRFIFFPGYTGGVSVAVGDIN